MHHIRFLSLLIVMFCAACSGTDAPADQGTIMFTSSHDCDFRLFDSQGRQLAREQYETGKPPTVVTMKSTGVFVIQATSPGQKEVKEPIAYPGGNMNYYIEF